MTARKRPAPTKDRPSPNATCDHSTARPQERHADLGLVDDDHTPDMRRVDS
jgi:hypothetical protein